MCPGSLEFYPARSFVVNIVYFDHSALLKSKFSPLSAARKSERLGTEDSNFLLTKESMYEEGEKLSAFIHEDRERDAIKTS